MAQRQEKGGLRYFIITRSYGDAFLRSCFAIHLCCGRKSKNAMKFTILFNRDYSKLKIFSVNKDSKQDPKIICTLEDSSSYEPKSNYRNLKELKQYLNSILKKEEVEASFTESDNKILYKEIIEMVEKSTQLKFHCEELEKTVSEGIGLQKYLTKKPDMPVQSTDKDLGLSK